jgi:hypothetical protein
METGRNHVSPSRKADNWRGDDRPEPVYGAGDRTKRPGVDGNFHLSPVAKGRLRPQGVGDRVDVSGPEPDRLCGKTGAPIASPSMAYRRGAGSHPGYAASISRTFAAPGDPTTKPGGGR